MNNVMTLNAAEAAALASRSDLVRRYDAQIPRYTSYPTAPHFQTAADDATYRDWLGQVAPGRTLSLYLHVPFCAAMCWYCGCNTRVAKQYQPIADYTELLLKEIDLLAEALPGGLDVTHVHWGGGTPTMLTPEDFARLMQALGRRFGLPAGADVGVEIDPRRLGPGMVAALSANGVTRASLGVQTFDGRVQRAINRIQPFDVVADAVFLLRAAGIDAINFDLLYGLPGQNEASLKDTIDRALTLHPTRIALFGYAHVPWMKPHQARISTGDLPGPGERLGHYLMAAERLARAGYVAIGLDHFARPDDPLAIAAKAGSLRRNFQGYTTDAADVLLGLGASAIGAPPQGYVQNAPTVPAYREAITAGRLATVRQLALSDEDRLRAAVIERLMCDLAVDTAALADGLGFPPAVFAADLARLAPMVADGLVTVEGGKVAVTERGRPFVRAAAACFDRYLTAGQTRHSRAI